jgi:putative ABC transport system substrate-binding protein
MRRREFIKLIGGAGAAWPLAARGQQTKTARIGFIGSGPASIYVDRMTALRSSLRDLGYLEGKNLTIEFRYADGNYERLPGIAAELVGLGLDVIVAAATPAIQAVQRATKTIPIVMSPATDPIGSGFIESLARPGGNITGVANMSADLSAKSLEILHSIVPGAARVAVLMSNNPSHRTQLDEIQGAARQFGLTLLSVRVATASEIDGLAGQLANMKCDSVLVFTDPLLISQRVKIAELAAMAKLPAVYQSKEHVEAGGLISYGASLLSLTRNAALYVDKILKGAKPADLPVEQPTAFELVINLKAAKALGLEIPSTLLAVADEVIE